MRKICPFQSPLELYFVIPTTSRLKCQNRKLSINKNFYKQKLLKIEIFKNKIFLKVVTIGKKKFPEMITIKNRNKNKK
jgi:hypothetical protein